eukprot:RCo035345
MLGEEDGDMVVLSVGLTVQEGVTGGVGDLVADGVVVKKWAVKVPEGVGVSEPNGVSENVWVSVIRIGVADRDSETVRVLVSGATREVEKLAENVEDKDEVTVALKRDVSVVVAEDEQVTAWVKVRVDDGEAEREDDRVFVTVALESPVSDCVKLKEEEALAEGQGVALSLKLSDVVIV